MVVAMLGVAAAATAMWSRYAPPGACLFCTEPEHYETALNTTSDSAGTAGLAGLAGSTRLQRSSDPSALGLPVTPPSGSTGSRHGEGSGHAWQPWGNGSSAHMFNASGSSAPSVGSGGLWRLITLAHRVDTSESHGSGPKEAREHHSSPSKPPSARPHPGSGSGSGVNLGAATPPTNPFDEHTSSPSDPFAPAPANGNSLDPGSVGRGRAGTSRGGASATPEPASLFLVGTGLLAAFAELRRRRAI
jgi:PEP-CTERM motif-containing protein